MLDHTQTIPTRPPETTTFPIEPYIPRKTIKDITFVSIQSSETQQVQTGTHKVRARILHNPTMADTDIKVFQTPPSAPGIALHDRKQPQSRL